MEVRLTVDQQSRLEKMAEGRGLATETLLLQAVEQMLSYEDWFSREVEQGIAEAGRGEFVAHEDVLKMLESRLRAK